ncbi:MAG TPA: sulfatase [Planctomycetaceae bacterium]|nr:sulfatase [Planctomycetaceae bacterium]HCP11567.1 sulfatase [Planctomycetaceae bacterium]
MHPIAESRQCLARRELFGRTSTGVGMAALASLLGAESARGAGTSLDSGQGGTGIPGLPHLAPRAKRVIYLFQNGAPTHVDLFDWKPRLRELHGQPLPAGYADGKRFSTMTGQADGKLMLAPVEPFRQRGESGAWVSDFLPWTAGIADRLCFVHSMHTEAVNHAPAIQFLLSGSQLPGRPTMGAWLTYGLGSETESLPGFVVMTSITKNTSCGQIFYDFYWGSGFLSSRFQGVKFRAAGDPVLYISNPPGISRQMRREWLDDIARVNELSQQQYGDPEIASRIAQYEMAFRMQSSVPELTDLSGETKETLEMYGPGVTEPGTFAHNCLLARRLVERGTRFVQLMHAGWDQHNSLTTELYNQCRDTDQPSAALVRDLEQRGLLDETLVIWGGEFGRTPFIQGDINNRPRWGRDHHPYAFTVWLAGGGIREGMSWGASDDLGINVADRGVHVHDLQATILHQLGIDHERLTWRFQGRQFRLTDIFGEVVQGILK